MEKDRWKEYDRGLGKAFNRFAGRIVNPADPNDPVLDAMRREATMYYSHLRLVAPGTQREDDSTKITRINAELVDNGDGQWRIGNRFFRG